MGAHFDISSKLAVQHQLVLWTLIMCIFCAGGDWYFPNDPHGNRKSKRKYSREIKLYDILILFIVSEVVVLCTKRILRLNYLYSSLLLFFVRIFLYLSACLTEWIYAPNGLTFNQWATVARRYETLVFQFSG